MLQRSDNCGFTYWNEPSSFDVCVEAYETFSSSTFPMPCTKKWLLLLHNCLHPYLLQVPPYSFKGQGLIKNVFEHLGALGRILNLPSFYEMHDMMEIGGGNLGRATTRGLGDF